MALADTLGPIVDVRFQNPGLSSGSELLLTAYLFSFQIYGDFSGYSDIARGLSRLFGIDLMRNFNQPYLSANITEFWRRWHISLSSWLRDYLYISLGGNRSGVISTYRNLLLTMLLGGLWHGANWTFVIWGGIHGLYLSVHKAWLSRHQPGSIAPRLTAGYHIISMVATFHLVTLTWVFFRSDTLGGAWEYLRGILTWQTNSGAFAELAWLSPRLLVPVAAVMMIDVVQNRSGHHAFLVGSHWALRGVIYAALVLITLTMGHLYGDVPFIYFQF